VSAKRLHALPDGAALAFEERGEGRPVLLLHGVLCSSRFFARNVDALAERFRVFAIDFRSHGDSPVVDGGHTVPQLARDLRHFVLAHDLRDAIAVGWSMGNFVVWDYLEQFEDDHRLAGHVIVSQGARDLIAADWPYGFTDPEGLLGLLRATQEDYEGVCRHVATIMSKELPSEHDQAWMIEEQRKLGANAATCILADQTQRDYRAALERVRVPTLAVWGRDEKCLPVAAGTWIAERTGAELHVFEESGHMPMWEEPERFNELVASWIERL
jgi:non-heme chloroperoxidase